MINSKLYKIIVPEEEHNIGQVVYNNLYCYISKTSLIEFYFYVDDNIKIEVSLTEESRKKLNAYNKIHRSGYYVYRPLIVKKYLKNIHFSKVLENE